MVLYGNCNGNLLMENQLSLIAQEVYQEIHLILLFLAFEFLIISDFKKLRILCCLIIAYVEN